MIQSLTSLSVGPPHRRWAPLGDQRAAARRHPCSRQLYRPTSATKRRQHRIRAAGAPWLRVWRTAHRSRPCAPRPRRRLVKVAAQPRTATSVRRRICRPFDAPGAACHAPCACREPSSRRRGVRQRSHAYAWSLYIPNPYARTRQAGRSLEERSASDGDRQSIVSSEGAVSDIRKAVGNDRGPARVRSGAARTSPWDLQLAHSGPGRTRTDIRPPTVMLVRATPTSDHGGSAAFRSVHYER